METIIQNVTYETIKEALELLVETKRSGKITEYDVYITGITCDITYRIPRDPLFFKSSKYKDIIFAVEVVFDEILLFVFEGNSFRINDGILSISIPYNYVATVPECVEEAIAEYGATAC